jgi:hypothetical protein
MDRVPVHNVAASITASARSWLQSLDRSRLNTEVPTATLEMWLEALIGLGGGSSSNLNSSARTAVMGHFARVDEEVRARQEDEGRKAEQAY